MAATWADIVEARKATPPASNIEDLLGELAQDGDLEAAIQLEVLRLDARVSDGEVRPCEAFAEALDAIARTMESVMLSPDLSEEARRTVWDRPMRRNFLTYAWMYLVGLDDRNNYGSALMMGPQTPKGSWDSVSPEWAVSHQDGSAGSGYMPPRADDDDMDRTGRKAHFLANAVLGHRFGSAGAIPANIWAISETSTTDNEVNALGVEFGRQLRGGGIMPGNTAGWVKARLCTEGRCAAGTITPELVGKLRYGLMTGEAKAAHTEIHTRHDPSATPSHTRREYQRDEKMTVTARVQSRPDSHAAVFGRAIDGSWKVTSVTRATGQPDQRLEGYGPITCASGELAIEGPGAGSYGISISGEASPSATDPSPSSYHFGAGGDDRSLCADESLSGSDSRKKSRRTVTRVGDPQNWGEMLRGASVHHDVTDTETTEWSWSWTFTFRAAPAPEHVPICARRYLYEEVMSAATGFISQVSQHLGLVISEMHMAGRAGDAEAIMRAYTESYTRFGEAAAALSGKSARIGDGCGNLDRLWIHGDDEGELQYQDALERRKSDIAEWLAIEEQLIDQLASAAEAVVDQVRAESAVAATTIEELAAKLRRERLESFVQ
jgi:hypothetical protein